MQGNTNQKRTAQEKEAFIMHEIKNENVKFEPRYQGSFLGNFFGISVRSN